MVRIGALSLRVLQQVRRARWERKGLGGETPSQGADGSGNTETAGSLEKERSTPGRTADRHTGRAAQGAASVKG